MCKGAEWGTVWGKSASVLSGYVRVPVYVCFETFVFIYLLFYLF